MLSNNILLSVTEFVPQRSARNIRLLRLVTVITCIVIVIIMVNTIITSFESVCVLGVKQTAWWCEWNRLPRTFCVSLYFPEYNKYFLQIFTETCDCALCLCKFNIIFSSKFPKGFDSRKIPLATSFHCAFQENEVINYSKVYILIRSHSFLVGRLLVCPYVSLKTSEDIIHNNSQNP